LRRGETGGVVLLLRRGHRWLPAFREQHRFFFRRDGVLWVLALELHEIPPRFPMFLLGTHRFGLFLFAFQHERHDLGRRQHLDLDVAHPVDHEHVLLPGLPRDLDITSAETDVWISIVGLVKVELRDDTVTFALFAPRFPVREDVASHADEEARLG
jgi:hypothetical protein